MTVGTAKRAVELDMVGTFKAELAAARARLNLRQGNRGRGHVREKQ